MSLILNLDPDPLVALFGTIGEDDARLTPTMAHALSFVSLLDRGVILLKWQDAALPTQAQWLNDLTPCL